MDLEPYFDFWNENVPHGDIKYPNVWAARKDFIEANLNRDLEIREYNRNPTEKNAKYLKKSVIDVKESGERFNNAVAEYYERTEEVPTEVSEEVPEETLEEESSSDEDDIEFLSPEPYEELTTYRQPVLYPVAPLEFPTERETVKVFLVKTDESCKDTDGLLLNKDVKVLRIMNEDGSVEHREGK